MAAAQLSTNAIFSFACSASDNEPQVTGSVTGPKLELMTNKSCLISCQKLVKKEFFYCTIMTQQEVKVKEKQEAFSALCYFSKADFLSSQKRLAPPLAAKLRILVSSQHNLLS